jgi:hypothetical protein
MELTKLDDPPLTAGPSVDDGLPRCSGIQDHGAVEGAHGLNHEQGAALDHQAHGPRLVRASFVAFEAGLIECTLIGTTGRRLDQPSMTLRDARSAAEEGADGDIEPIKSTVLRLCLKACARR